MKKVIFYLIESVQAAPASEGQLAVQLLAHEKLACQKAAQAWAERKRVLINCQTQAQAENIDEYLWQLNGDDFVPHNLAGEGPAGGSPIEICWPGKRSNRARQLLINLQHESVEFASVFSDVIDFVPFDEHLKTMARERYKNYKNVGFNLKTIPVAM